MFQQRIIDIASLWRRSFERLDPELCLEKADNRREHPGKD